MNKTKCIECGVVNWATASQCLRCKSPILAEDSGHADHAMLRPSTASEHGSQKPIGAAIAYLVCGLIIASLVYLVLLKPPGKRAAENTEGPTASSQAVLTEAVPPPDFNVTQPRIGDFSKFVVEEVSTQNAVWANDASFKQVTKEDQLKECPTHLGYDGWEKCRQSLDARNHTAAYNDPTKFCRAKFDGTPQLAEAGRYHRFDKDIFYVVKVKVEGEDGVPGPSGCTTKRSPAPLTAVIHLKWSPNAGENGWKKSHKGEFDTRSLEYHKGIAKAKKDEYDKASDERWKQRGREEANRRLQSNTKFQPLIPNAPVN